MVCGSVIEPRMTPSWDALTVTPVVRTVGIGSQPAKPMSVPVIMVMVPISMVIMGCGPITSSCIVTVISVPCWHA